MIQLDMSLSILLVMKFTSNGRDIDQLTSRLAVRTCAMPIFLDPLILAISKSEAQCQFLDIGDGMIEFKLS